MLDSVGVAVGGVHFKSGIGVQGHVGMEYMDSAHPETYYLTFHTLL